MIYDYFDEIKIGDKMVSRGRTITQTDVVLFCMFTANWEPFHCDVEYVKKTRFKQILVQSSLLYAIGPGLLPLPPEGPIIAFYGLDRMRCPNPVFEGDTIHVEREIIDKQERGPDSGVVSLQMTFKNQKDETVQVNIMKLLVAKRPSATLDTKD